MLERPLVANGRASNWTAIAGVVAIIAMAAFGGMAWIINTVNINSEKTMNVLHEEAMALDRRITTLEAQRISEQAAIERLVMQVDKLHEIETDLNIAVQKMNDLSRRGK